jgi:Tat protein secretion system quality control protein TatD with DNase activity
MRQQKLAFEKQSLIAREPGLPVVLHCRGHSLFRQMFDSISSFLPFSHPVQWHRIKADSDLRVINEFISVFQNSVVSLNGASTYDRDVDKDEIYKKWIA